jgi:hypothetical protein
MAAQVGSSVMLSGKFQVFWKSRLNPIAVALSVIAIVGLSQSLAESWRYLVEDTRRLLWSIAKQQQPPLTVPPPPTPEPSPFLQWLAHLSPQTGVAYGIISILLVTVFVVLLTVIVMVCTSNSDKIKTCGSVCKTALFFLGITLLIGLAWFGFPVVEVLRAYHSGGHALSSFRSRYTMRPSCDWRPPSAISRPPS